MRRRYVFTLAAQPPLPFKAAEEYAEQALLWSSEVPDNVLIQRDLAYGPATAHRYDVFAPPGARSAPVLIFLHGGGWTNGYKEFVSFMAENVTRMGMVLIAPTYRLAPEHRLPSAIDDCRRLLAHLALHAADFGGDAGNIYLSGHSAGGHLATMVTLQTVAAAAAGIPTAMIRACLPISGIMDIHHPAPVPDSLDDRVYTMLLDRPEDDALMSPMAWAGGNRIPFVLSYGEQDSDRVILSNRRLARVLEAQPGPSKIIMRPLQSHFDTHLTLRDPQDPWYAELQRLVRNNEP